MKLLKKDDYSVIVSDNGLITFEGFSNKSNKSLLINPFAEITT